MSTEQKSVIRKLVDANKDFAKTTINKTQEVAGASVDYNREIWLAGLGAFSQAREEGVRAFDKLVERGQDFEETTRNKIDDTAADAKVKIDEAFDKISNPDSTLEDIFDSRVARAIKKMGVPTANTLKSISEQLLDISDKVSKFSETKEETVEEAPVAAKKAPKATKAEDKKEAKK